MKEIKFRAWDENKKRMIFPTSIMWKGLRTSLCFDHSSPNEDVSDEFPEGHLVGITDSDFPLMQYTGLHDKNGKEIYEGDVVEDDRVVGADKNVIIPELPRLFHLYGEHVFVPDEVQVIGNVHENPELLA